MTDYLSGFGNGFESEALPGALPVGRNSPQQCAYGLYGRAAQWFTVHPRPAPAMNGPGCTGFAPAWPTGATSVPLQTDPGSPTDRAAYWRSAPDDAPPMPIAQMRWNALPMAESHS